MEESDEKIIIAVFGRRSEKGRADRVIKTYNRDEIRQI